MLHCFNCGSDLPDNLAFCLHCGARLDDETATVVHTARRTQADDKPPVITTGSGTGLAKLVIGGLLGAGAVIAIFVVLGVVLYSMQGNTDQSSSANDKTPTPTLTPTPTPKPKTPTPTPDESQADNTSEEECDITNPQGGDVNLRRDCDTKDCSQDPSTLYIQVSPGEMVVPTGKPRVTTGKFTWVQVKYNGEILWVSSTRIDCY